jgi:hypothetical protein
MQVGANDGSFICAEIAKYLGKEIEIRLGRASREVPEKVMCIDFSGAGEEDLEEATIRLLAAQQTWQQNLLTKGETFCTELLALIANAKRQTMSSGNA